MDDNIWEYPFGELEEDEDIFFRKPGLSVQNSAGLTVSPESIPASP